jgi:hypothetical protein
MDLTTSYLVPKTVTVSVTLTPADRIGSGRAFIDQPATFLSQGQFLMPRLPDPEHRSRRQAVDFESMPADGGPAGPAGRCSSASACWRSGYRRTSAARATTVGKPTTAARNRNTGRLHDRHR